MVIGKKLKMTPRDRDEDTDDYDVPQFDRRRGGGDALSWRVGAIERALKSKADDKDVDNIKEDVKQVADELNSLRRAIVIFSLSMIGTGGMFLLGILTLINNAH
jgi:hypothetical protein